MESSVNLDTNVFENLTIFPQQESEPNYGEFFGPPFPHIEAALSTNSRPSHEEPFIHPRSSSNALEASELALTTESTQDLQNQYNATGVPVPAESNDNSINPVLNLFSGTELLNFPEIDVFQDLEALLFGTAGNAMAPRFTKVHDDNSAAQVGQTSAIQETLEREVDKRDAEEPRESSVTSTRRRRRVLGPVKGNNKKGRSGVLRCTECRKVHLKCIFSDENNPCMRCQSKDLICRKVFGKKGEALRVFKNLLTAVSIPRSPSVPGYIAIPDDEQHGIHFLYTIDLPWRYGTKSVIAMRLRGIYVQDPCLRYAMLTLSANMQWNEAKCQLYWSQFESAIRKVSSGRSHIDLLHALIFMSKVADSHHEWDKMQTYIDGAVEILDDVLSDRVKISLTSKGITVFDAISFLRAISIRKPICLHSLESAGGTLSGMDLTISQCLQIEPLFGNCYGEWGRKLSGLIEYTKDIGITIRLCYIKYLESKLKGESFINTVVPLLKRVQERIDYLKDDAFFADITSMDILFVSRKLRPIGIVNNASYQGILYPESGIDPCLTTISRLNEYVYPRGELIDSAPSGSATSEETHGWFKKVSGFMRREFWAYYDFVIILLDIIETMLHGYSARDGGDAAVKLVLLVGEMQSQDPMRNVEFPAAAFSLAELQLRRVNRSDELNWVLAIKRFTNFMENPYLPDWFRIQDDVEICKGLLSHYSYFQQ